MKKLRTLKELDDIDLKQEAIMWVIANQTGNGVNRDIIPKNMRGDIAKDIWNDSKFTLGIEYGAIAMLIKLFDITNKDLNVK